MARAEFAELRIEVVYCPSADGIDRVELELPAGATLLEALQRSGLLERHAGVDLAQQRVGVWGRARRLDEVLHDGDRVELYRALQVDPKQARRLRSAREDRRAASARRSRSPTR